MTRDEELTALAGFLDHFRQWANEAVFENADSAVDEEVRSAWLTAFDKATDRLLHLTGQPVAPRAEAPRRAERRARLRVV